MFVLNFVCRALHSRIIYTARGQATDAEQYSTLHWIASMQCVAFRWRWGECTSSLWAVGAVGETELWCQSYLMVCGSSNFQSTPIHWFWFKVCHFRAKCINIS